MTANEYLDSHLENLHVQDLLDNRGHIVILVLRKTASKDDILFLFGQFAVFFGELVVSFIIDGVVWFHAVFVFGGVFFRDDCFRNAIDLGAEHFEMFVFDDSRVRLVMRSVVDDGVSLEVRSVFNARLETDGSPVEFAKAVAEVFINGACVDELIGNFVPVVFIFVKEVYACTRFDSGEQAVNELVVTANRDALILVVKVVVVKYETHWEALDDECRQVFAIAAPLLFGVFLDKLFKDVLADERECLFFEVCRLAAIQCGYGFGFLFFDFCHCFCRCCNAPHLVECVHVERQIVTLSFVVRNRAVRVAIEFYDGIDEVPYLFVASMENMGSVIVNIDPFNVFAIDIASKLCSLVYDEAFFPGTGGAVCKCGTEKA